LITGRDERLRPYSAFVSDPCASSGNADFYPKSARSEAVVLHLRILSPGLRLSLESSGSSPVFDYYTDISEMSGLVLDHAPLRTTPRQRLLCPTSLPVSDDPREAWRKHFE
jgi:hypothetical protein